VVNSVKVLDLNPMSLYSKYNKVMFRQNVGESSISQQASQVNSSSKLSNEVNEFVDRIDRISAGPSAFKEQVPHIISINARELEFKFDCLQDFMSSETYETLSPSLFFERQRCHFVFIFFTNQSL
jgi:hypothetical protein